MEYDRIAEKWNFTGGVYVKRLVPLSPYNGEAIYGMLQQITLDDNGFHSKVLRVA